MKWLLCLRYSSMLLAGLLAGSSFAFVLGMAPALQELSTEAYIEVHRSMGGLSAWTVFLYVLLVGSSGVVLWMMRREWRTREFIFIAFALLCVLDEVFIAWRGNLPLSRLIDSWQMTTPPENWIDVRLQWMRFMYMRSVLLLTGFGLLLAANFSSARTATPASQPDAFVVALE